eukprot:TRINITY_DN55292_c0_g1_i1.p1 TRINITY_DN55292_c0_g1~~TRINITY_DN55292_c0_g1_i1.p1  ORF type:complete len:402 (-),score=91.64 TRINITY_DN55292_c0_g1_i1:344-1549(-)
MLRSLVGSEMCIRDRPWPATAHFTHNSGRESECLAWDAKSRMDFSSKSGLTFAWYNSTRDTSFVYELCGQLEQYYGVDITTTTCTNCGNSMGHMVQALLIRDEAASGFNERDVATWGAVEYTRFVQNHGSQGPPCNNVYDRVSERTVGDPNGVHSPQAAGRSALVEVYCGSCTVADSSCKPCPDGSGCSSITPVDTNPVTGETTSPGSSSDTGACVCASTANSACFETTIVVITCPENADNKKLDQKLWMVVVVLMVLVTASAIHSAFVHNGNLERSSNFAVQITVWLTVNGFSANGCVQKSFRWLCRVRAEPVFDAAEDGDDDLNKAVDEVVYTSTEAQADSAYRRVLQISRAQTQRSMTILRGTDLSFNQGLGFKYQPEPVAGEGDLQPAPHDPVPELE